MLAQCCCSRHSLPCSLQWVLGADASDRRGCTDTVNTKHNTGRSRHKDSNEVVRGCWAQQSPQLPTLVPARAIRKKQESGLDTPGNRLPKALKHARLRCSSKRLLQRFINQRQLHSAPSQALAFTAHRQLHVTQITGWETLLQSSCELSGIPLQSSSCPALGKVE